MGTSYATELRRKKSESQEKNDKGLDNKGDFYDNEILHSQSYRIQSKSPDAMGDGLLGYGPHPFAGVIFEGSF